MFFIQDNGNILLWFFAKRSPLKSKDIPIFGSEGYNHTRMVTHERWELIGNITIGKFKKFWTEIYIVPRASRKHSFQQKFDSRMFFIHLTELLQSIKCFEYRFLELKVWFGRFVCTFVWCTITTLFVSLHHIFLIEIRVYILHKFRYSCTMRTVVTFIEQVIFCSIYEPSGLLTVLL